MLYKQLISAAFALTLGATQVAAVSHGDVEDYEGGKIKWHQFAEGGFRAVDLEEWDDKSECFPSTSMIFSH